MPIRPNQDVQDVEMPFTEHLGELRNRVLYSVLAIVACSIGGFVYAKEIIGFLMGPLKAATAGTTIQPDLHYLSLTEPLFQSFKIALFTGIAFAFPFWVWQIWLFVAPGLRPHERRLASPVVGSAFALFLTGATFAYFVAVPAAYHFLLLYASPLQIQPPPPTPQGGLSIELVAMPPKKPSKQSPAPPKGSVLEIDLPTLQSLFTQLQGAAAGRKGQDAAPSLPPQSRPTTAKSATSKADIPLRLRIRAKELLPPRDPNRVDLLQAIQTLLQQKALEIRLQGVPQRYQLRYQWDFPKGASEAWGQLKPNLTLEAYLTISSWFLLGFGLVFQTPLLIFLLGIFGIAPPSLLGQYRRHAFIIILVISAVLTPTGDPLNLMIMALPMYILFEIGLLVAHLFLRHRDRNDPLITPPPASSPPPPSGSGSSSPPPSGSGSSSLPLGGHSAENKAIAKSNAPSDPVSEPQGFTLEKIVEEKAKDHPGPDDVGDTPIPGEAEMKQDLQDLLDTKILPSIRPPEGQIIPKGASFEEEEKAEEKIIDVSSKEEEKAEEKIIDVSSKEAKKEDTAFSEVKGKGESQ